MISQNYKMWKAEIGLPNTCIDCIKLHGKVYEIGKSYRPKPPIHPFCRCRIGNMEAIYAGTATDQGLNGADWWLLLFGELPDYYVSEAEAKQAGWLPSKHNFHNALPGKMLAKGIYKNKNDHLPSAPGRIWYEADIDYYSGRRNKFRILYSNDGLIFVTYDHYETFKEILTEVMQ